MSNEIQTFTCEICIKLALFTQKFSHDGNCIHNICHVCIASHIQAKVDDNIATIICPELDCGKTLNPLDCRLMIPPTLFVKWCNCLCRSFVSTRKSSYCPNRNCSELILDECEGTTKKCTCPRCKRLFCFACRVPWHSGFWCRESSQQRDANDVRFGLLLERMEWSRCPNCGQSIERIDGCLSILCRCGKKFCYKCGLEPHVGKCGKGNMSHDTAGFIVIFCVLAIFIVIIFAAVIYDHLVE